MRLAETQKLFATALLSPGGSQGSVHLAARLLKPNDLLTARQRLNIYRESYWARLVDALKDDFPGLLKILGVKAFEELAKAYLSDHPSKSFTLRDLGSRLEQWLQQNSKFAGKQYGLALDMVRLEWAHIMAFDGPANPTLCCDDLFVMSPRLRLSMQPYISLLDLNYPVDVRPTKGAPKRTFLAVHRLDNTVYYRRLESNEFQLLSALRKGVPIGKALTALHATPAQIQIWFATWTRFGWLCKRRKQ